MTDLVRVAMPIVGFLVVAACVAGLALGGQSPDEGAIAGQRTGATTESSAVSLIALPPIDTASPAETETATFALG
jgi:hypothetical protein